MFMFKKIVAQFFYPVPLCLEIMGLGLLLLWCTRRQRAGKILVTAGVGLLAFFSFGFGADLLLKPLEHRYPPLMQPAAGTSVKWVVVLGGGINPDPQLPDTSCIGGASLYRVLEGVRLYKQMPGSKLVLSGGAVFHSQPEAEVMAEIARIMGAAPRDLVLESTSGDTEAQAGLIKDLVGRDQLVLVTAACHMPRAMALFQKQGLNPLPAPTGYFLHQGSRFGPDPGSWFPRGENLKGAEAAVHEYLGLVWARLRGAI